MQIPLILGFLATALVIVLLLLDRKPALNEKGVRYISKLGLSDATSQRLLSTLKGFLLIVLLAAILGAFLYYTQ
jgi:hypothetical protein